MGKYFGPPDSSAPEWYNQPAVRVVAGLAGLVLLLLIFTR